MSSLTVDILKAALTSQGIKVPYNARKSEYVKLYKEHVAPLHNIEINSYHQFSSDDEEITLTKQSKDTSESKIITKMPEDSFEDLDVSSLSDDDLFSRLSKFGVTSGPIVDSTRRIYQRKLIKLMGGDVVDSSFNGEVDVDEAEGYSDHEEEQTSNGNKSSQTITKMTYSSSSSSTKIQTPVSTLRSRTSTTSDESQEKFPSLSGGVIFYNQDRHTPSPRASLRTVTSTTKYTSGGGKNIRETTSTRHAYPSSSYPNEAETAESESRSYLIRLLVKLFILILLMVVLYATYHYVYSESPFKGLENLAKEALDSAGAPVKKAAKKKV